MADAFRGMMGRAATFACGCLLLAGCASPPTLWHLNGRTQAQLEAANDVCRREAAGGMNYEALNTSGRSAALGGGYALAGAMLAGAVIADAEARHEQCMAYYGFRRDRR